MVEMKMRTRLLAICLVIMMLVGMISGCGQDPTTTTNPVLGTNNHNPNDGTMGTGGVGGNDPTQPSRQELQ